MSAISPPQISARITKPLKQVAQRQWTVLAARGMVQTLVIGMAVLLAIAIPLGYFEHMPVWLRIALSVIGWGSIATTAVLCLRPALHKWTISRAAQMAERSLHDTEERISSAVELSQAPDQFRGSPELVAHLIKQAENDAARVKATSVVPFKAVFVWAALFVPVVLMWMGVTYFFPNLVESGLFHSVMPGRPNPITLTTVEVVADKLVVTEGDAWEVNVSTQVYDDRQIGWAKLVPTDEGAQAAGEPVTMERYLGKVSVNGVEAKADRVCFKATLPNRQKSFTYKVVTDRDDPAGPSTGTRYVTLASHAGANGEGEHVIVTPKVTVMPLPKVAAVDVKYDYPKYSRQYRNFPADEADKTDKAVDQDAGEHDFNVRAVAGTGVTLTLHTSAPLDLSQSKIVVNQLQSEVPTPVASVALTPGAKPNTYQAHLYMLPSYIAPSTGMTANSTSANSMANQMAPGHTTYTIKLASVETVNGAKYTVPGKDLTYPLVAYADLPPDTSIPKAAPKDLIRVRPDEDRVVLVYHAWDHYGVDHVNLLVSVDDRPDHVIPVAIHTKNHRSIEEQWVLSVPAMLKFDGVATANHISYQFESTDNREPNPFGALLRGVNNSNVFRGSLTSFVDLFPNPQTTLSERRTLVIDQAEKESLQERLNEVAKKKLEEAIREAITRLNLDAVKVGGVGDVLARGSVLPAYYEDLMKSAGKHVAVTGTDLATVAQDYFETPFADVAKKAKSIADNEIAQAANDTSKILAEKTRGVAVKARDEIVDSRDKLQKLLAEVEAAAKKAEAAELVKEAAKIQEEVAKAMAEHPENLAENLKKQQEAINKLQEALQKDPTLQNAQAVERAKAIAELENKIQQDQQKQTELQNQTAKQEEQQQAQAAANAIAEEQKKLNQEVQKFAEADKKALEQAKAQTPDQQQQQQLVKNIEANKLQDAAQQAEKAAEQLQKDAQQLEKAAQAPAPKADKAEAAAQQQQQQKQAAQDKQNEQAAAQAQKNAEKAAQELKKDAAADKPKADAVQQAAQATEKAAQQIAKQAQKIEDQNQQGAQDPAVQKAAEAAKADAQQAAKDAQAAAEAAKDNNAAEAKQDADKAAAEVAKAGHELNQAAQAEANADQAKAKADNAQAAADQAQAQKQNQEAAAQAAEQAKALAQQQKQIADALAQQAQQQADAQQNATTPQQAGEQQKQLAQQTQQAQKAAEQLAQQAQANQDPNLAKRAEDAGKALEQAAKDQQQAAQADAAGKPADAAAAQADAQQALAKADQALRGAPDPAQAQAAADAQAQAQAQAAQGQPEQGQPGQPEKGQPGQPEKGQPGQPEQGQPGQPEQGQPGQGPPQQTAAQAAAEAAQAQQQALQPNPAAAAEAAQALAQAAQAAQQALPGQPGQPEQGQAEQGNEPGQHPGEHPGQTPHAATDPKMGISGADEGGDNKVPATVAALGISPSDWAKLKQDEKTDLQNALQQKVAPAYKEQVKNYYLRRAHLESAK